MARISGYRVSEAEAGAWHVTKEYSVCQQKQQITGAMHKQTDHDLNAFAITIMQNKRIAFIGLLGAIKTDLRCNLLAP